ncbi:MAG: dihydrofolate reductase [Ignavibacteriales bacterium]|nr:dihydrofolate reductase [Ignavibacteriales bacterium]
MKLILIAALTRSRVIGKDRAVPWDIPEDMQRFKKQTLGHVVLMGRGTYETLSSPLTNRRNVVLTSRSIEGVETFPTISGALEVLQNEGEVYVIGGGQIFAQLLLSADELRLTLVDQEIDGDTFFPPYEHLVGSLFQLASKEEYPGFSFLDYARIG